MASYLLDYFLENLLFDKKRLENDFGGVPEKELREALDLYRQLCLHQLANYKRTQGIRVNVGNEGQSLPSKTFLKQSALYVDKVIVSDPVFNFTYRKSQEQINRDLFLYGIQNSGEIKRKELSDNIRYILSMRDAIAYDFLDILPLDVVREVPRPFVNKLPENLEKWFQENVIVNPLIQLNDEWKIVQTSELLPCREINIGFRNHSVDSVMQYFNVALERSGSDEQLDSGSLERVLTPPSQEEFSDWLMRCVKEASLIFMNDIITNLRVSDSLHSIPLTTSPFVAQTVEHTQMLSRNLKSDVANTVLDLDLPILESVELGDILSLRKNDGEAFQNFRLYLESKLKELRQIEDAATLKIAIENIEHELSEVQLQEIERKIKQAKRSIKRDAVIGYAGFLGSFFTGGVSLLALLYAGADMYKNIDESQMTIKENPAFFLWKLQQSKTKK
jgi:hypothetical protein